MTSPPILASVQWEPTGAVAAGDGLPFATHSGVLEIAGHSLRCYRLSDGRAVFAADDLARFFDEALA